MSALLLQQGFWAEARQRRCGTWPPCMHLADCCCLLQQLVGLGPTSCVAGQGPHTAGCCCCWRGALQSGGLRLEPVQAGKPAGGVICTVGRGREGKPGCSPDPMSAPVAAGVQIKSTQRASNGRTCVLAVHWFGSKSIHHVKLITLCGPTSLCDGSAPQARR